MLKHFLYLIKNESVFLYLVNFEFRVQFNKTIYIEDNSPAAEQII